MSQDVVPETVVLEYESTAEDLRETVRVLSRKRRGLTGLVCRPVTWVVLGLLGAAVIAAGAGGRSGSLLVLGAVLLAEAVLLPFLPRLSARQQIKAMGSLLVPCRVTVDEDGMRTVTAAMDTRMAWEAFGSYVETDRLFVLRGPERSGMRGGWLAKRGLAGPAEVDRLRTLLDRRLPRA